MSTPGLTLSRSNIEDAKRLFLDRLTVDTQPLLQGYDTGPGDPYDYSGILNAFDFGIGGDCSGLDGIVIGAALFGFSAMQWIRQFTTETFPSPFNQYFTRTSQADCINGNYPIKVFIMHGGGGPNSHMMCIIDGWQMESNGTYGVCTAGAGGTLPTDPMWNDWLVCNLPITEDTGYRQAMGYPVGLDYAGGAIPGAVLAAAGISFVMRYISPGGSSLPGKQITGPEFTDLGVNSIGVGLNHETDATFMVENNGASDAQWDIDFIGSLPNPPTNPFVWYSCDFDEAQSQDQQIFAYLNEAASVLGGVQNVGLYGPYYICERALNAGVVSQIWQTEAWSGFDPGNPGGSDDNPHIDSRVAIMQRSNVSYPAVNGISVDFNEAHIPGAGIYLPTPATPISPVPSPVNPAPVIAPGPPTGDAALLVIMEQLMGPFDSTAGTFTGWPQNGRGTNGNFRSLNDMTANMQTIVTAMSKGNISSAQLQTLANKLKGR